MPLYCRQTLGQYLLFLDRRYQGMSMNFGAEIGWLDYFEGRVQMRFPWQVTLHPVHYII